MLAFRFWALIGTYALVLTACASGNSGPAFRGAASQGLRAQSARSPASVATPFSYDDWTTYAHDAQRTGYERQYTGMSTRTVPNLQLAWRVKVAKNGFVAGPLVYDGLVIVAGSRGGVYALNALNGRTVWEMKLPASLPPGALSVNVRGTPTIDGNLLFIGDMYKGLSAQPFPSDVFALNLTTGAVLWKQRLGGILRGQPLAMGGRLYIGTAGGDPPFCLQGGMQALDESTGQVLWSWFTSPVAGNGGSSWSAVTFDGEHIVFGTGNTCTQAEPTAQAVVALNLDGSVAWVFQPQDDQNNSDTSYTGVDNDQGGGISYANGTYYLENKDGHFYVLNGSGGLEYSEVLGGFGTIATPTTDGSTTILADEGAMRASGVRAGARITEFYLDLPATGKPRFLTPQGVRPLMNLGPSGIVAYDLAGNRRWSKPSTDPIYEYAAINDDFTVAGINGTLAAFDLQSGKPLWTFANPLSNDYFLGGPVIVPSGVYADDLAGYVYAFRVSGPACWHGPCSASTIERPSHR
jgi:outer membrane protein assembly factor BamB